ncbi:DoxX family protein [Pontibacillus halophilus JSM 076056 = DSM 19796]|uniref:DoxX family protein n=1 Tax=Pontibacillus halophilus JSM 076056 = DSM 19796 TaxID=1385510 RepID=A0A0A5GNX6_9BACI|nr:DoxX family protein [Pontibacillus halophilus]KGX92870.1 DoxX family protein [Pontibacillus halophilus JSM 076056 = DSM 19796]
MDVAVIVIQVLLGLGFIMFGAMKFGAKQMVDEFNRYGYPSSFRMFTGTIEVAAAILMIVGIWNGALASIGAALIIVTMIGAILTHVKVGDPPKAMGMPIILLLLGVVVLVVQLTA